MKRVVPATPPSAPAKSWWPRLAAGIVVLALAFRLAGSWQGYHVINGDGVGYYAYLPALVIDRSSSFAGVRAALARYDYVAAPGADPYRWTSLVRLPSGREINFYYAGLAFIQAPFFLAAHALAIAGGWPADGFSPPYQAGVAAAAIACLLAGLYALKLILKPWLSPSLLAGTLLAVVFGTNLFYAATLGASSSHIYSFALIAWLLHAAMRWHRAPSVSAALRCGILLGLIGWVRPTNLICALLVVGCGFTDMGGWLGRLRRHGWQLLLALTVAALPLAGQAAYYHRQTGEWLLNSYRYAAVVPAQIFALPSLEIIMQVLFGVSKGLFFWFPILLFTLPGLLWPPAWLRPHRPVVAILLALQVTVISSYFCWSYAAGFGHRGFTDYLALFALPLAATLQRWQGTRLARPLLVLVLALIALNIIQMLQYYLGNILGEGMTWELYRMVFLRFDLPALQGI